MVVSKIKKTTDTSWLELPAPISMAPVVNALDSSKSGRDNNLGNMFRDKIAEKQEYTLTFPAKLSNTQVAQILNIIMEESFDCWCPNPKNGTFGTKTFYCASCAPQIQRIFSETYWEYAEFDIEATEM